MGIMNMKRRSLDALRGKWGKVILLTILISILTMYIPLAMDIRSSGGFELWMKMDETSSGSLFSFVLEIVLIPFYASVLWFYLGLVRKEDKRIRDIFNIQRWCDDVKTDLDVYCYVFLCFSMVPVAHHPRNHQESLLCTDHLCIKRSPRVYSNPGHYREQKVDGWIQVEVFSLPS
ncbi:hypothetical protein [Paenibacillus sp. Marseille-Q4541]|uniref:hypothetical protein n=1 Tax=Paenibacillus sp. Marseille-Q4541 TaxID=2831522 RepID=UPI002018720B|nr:hypothetical protein [Paenibacillus sp. Marseille-Q4541]